MRGFSPVRAHRSDPVFYVLGSPVREPRTQNMKIITFENRPVLRTSKNIAQLLLDSNCLTTDFDELCWLPAKAGGYHAWMSHGSLRNDALRNLHLGIFTDYLTLEEQLETTHTVS